MGRKRTLLLAGLTACAGATGLAAAPLDRRFAACTGRLSALMEHQWLLSDPAADVTRARRDAMAGLLEAAMAPGDGPQLRALRIQAKYAQSVLLTRATFNRNPADARWAARRAQAEIAGCAALLAG